MIQNVWDIDKTLGIENLIVLNAFIKKERVKFNELRVKFRLEKE